MSKFTVSLSETEAELLRQAASRAKRSPGNFIEFILMRALANEDAEPTAGKACHWAGDCQYFKPLGSVCEGCNVVEFKA